MPQGRSPLWINSGVLSSLRRATLPPGSSRVFPEVSLLDPLGNRKGFPCELILTLNPTLS
ncbi:hypothetical protein BDN72DRAFT_832905 [Pluteus cervinus]|uniref:Uncharacterized protein n=1 Tax=Pluteus cervinus TaxID=181527 RepID=A0ACD3BB56_9AGAR|nr:hypothetical protein BDN72DRAFT_832905 [Pluteus cervinus]